jgi:acetylglutamate kinase
MKDWIKKALTKHIRQRTKTIEIPPDPRLVYGVKFTIATTIILSTLEIAHMAILGKWNSEIFAAITGLSGTVMGISVGQKT